MELLVENFLRTDDVNVGINILRICRFNGLVNLGATLARYFSHRFPCDVAVWEERGLLYRQQNKFIESYRTFQRLLKNPNLSGDQVKHFLEHQRQIADKIIDHYTTYDTKRVQKFTYRKKSLSPRITLTMTSCKRLDLFKKTVNSFLNCCRDIDLIDEWICIDDNSSKSDLAEMAELYPFMSFYWKSPEEKGHPQSMNLIRDMVKTPYIFHLEDDWCFFERRNYISECLEVLNQNAQIGQCLINKNYSEIPSDKILGGFFNITASGLRFYIHEFCPNEETQLKFTERHGSGPHCFYWPHFSFRPGLMKTEVLHKLGSFNETVSHFEMEYSHRYVNAGYVTAFLESIYCKHIGRLTSEMNDETKLNAYKLNGEKQFTGKEEQLKQQEPNRTVPKSVQISMRIFVINLDRRPDRWEKFKQNSEINSLQYARFSAVDGQKLKPTLQLQRIFENNDYNMRSGIVGCALSHLQLYIQLLNDTESDIYCIFEDDITFTKNFIAKFKRCLNKIYTTDWDLFYLGHHDRIKGRTEAEKSNINKETEFTLVKTNPTESLQNSLGGAFAYIITKTGAQKLLDFIEKTGMTNAIDTMHQKFSNVLNVYYVKPSLVFSECLDHNSNIDTDIQKDYTSLSIEPHRQIELLQKQYSSNFITTTNKNIIDSQIKENKIICYHSDNLEELKILKNKYIFSYIIANKYIIISNTDRGDFYQRFKRNGKYDLFQALQTN